MRTRPRGCTSIGACAALLFTIAGCGESPVALERMGGGVTFRVHEVHARTGQAFDEPRVELALRTKAEFPCYNYRIESDVGVRSSEVIVRLGDVVRPRICLTAIGPARFRTELPLGNGEYALRFIHGDRIDHHTVTIDDDAITIVPGRAAFSMPEIERFWRYPPDSFAYLCRIEGNDAEPCDAFGDLLITEVGATPFTFPAGGEVPYPETYTVGQAVWLARYYRSRRDADFERAGELLRAFAADHPDLRFYIENWRGRSYRSWRVEG